MITTLKGNSKAASNSRHLLSKVCLGIILLFGGAARTEILIPPAAQQLRSDELSGYEGIVDEANHKICLAHWRKRKMKRDYEIQRQLKLEGLEYAANDMLELAAILRQDHKP